jgi:glucokinase
MDLGGTKILAAVVDAEGHILAEAKQKTKAQKGPDYVLRRMAETAQEAVQSAQRTWEEVQAVGVGAPGPLDPVYGIVHHTPNLPGWQDVPLAPRLVELLGVPVFLENDVNLGTLGEHKYGAGRGIRDMVGVFVGTGVGGGLILDGKLRSGFRHAAAEVGHMIVLADGPVCGCGKRGCLESVASRTAIERDIRLGLAAGRESRIPELASSGTGEITSGVLARAVELGDPLAVEVISRAQWYLGLLTASIVNLVDPEMVVFGGGVVEALGEKFVAPIAITAKQYFIKQADADKVRFVAGSLGDHAAVLGAVAYARQRAAR